MRFTVLIDMTFNYFSDFPEGFLHSNHLCVSVARQGSDAVSCGSDEEAGLYGCPAELHLSPQSGTPAGKPEVRGDHEMSTAPVCLEGEMHVKD